MIYVNAYWVLWEWLNPALLYDQKILTIHINKDGIHAISSYSRNIILMLWKNTAVVSCSIIYIKCSIQTTWFHIYANTIPTEVDIEIVILLWCFLQPVRAAYNLQVASVIV